MGAVNDLRGRRFGRLVVLENADYEIRGTHAYWPVHCDCSADKRKRPVKWVRGAKLLNGRIASCGCLRSDPTVRAEARKKTPKAVRKAHAQKAIETRWAKAVAAEKAVSAVSKELGAKLGAIFGTRKGPASETRTTDRRKKA